MRSIKSVSLIGSGNVGTHLATALYRKKIKVVDVFSRKKANAKLLAQQVDATPITKLSKLSKEVDLVIIAIHDDAIADMTKQLDSILLPETIVAHTSGSVPSTVIDRPKSGVFYPLQTITIERKVNMLKVPFCIHAADEKIARLLTSLAKKISKDVRAINDEQRAILHLAAVTVNNFSNHLFHLTEKLCAEHNVDVDILNPLLEETIAKLRLYPAVEIQTGPARRNDKQTIEKHLSQLKDHKQLKKIYKVITESIINTYH